MLGTGLNRRGDVRPPIPRIQEFPGRRQDRSPLWRMSSRHQRRHHRQVESRRESETLQPPVSWARGRLRCPITMDAGKARRQLEAAAAVEMTLEVALLLFYHSIKSARLSDRVCIINLDLAVDHTGIPVGQIKPGWCEEIRRPLNHEINLVAIGQNEPISIPETEPEASPSQFLRPFNRLRHDHAQAGVCASSGAQGVAHHHRINPGIRACNISQSDRSLCG